jgi:tripartite-type tricarboxylate transporter receptor subunit TctC
MKRRIFLKQASTMAVAFALPQVGRAQADWPAKAIHLVVPVAPGGSIDMLTRTLSKPLALDLGQSIIVENIAGGGGNIAFGQVARAKPDGYTLLMGWDAMLINPALYSVVPFQMNQYAPVTLAITSPQVLVVGPKLSVKSLKEFLDAARRLSGALSLANAGNGSPGHLAGTLLETEAKIKLTHVPYKGGGPAVADLLAGHVDALMVTLPAALQHIKSGRLVALGMSSASRSTAVPSIPTIAEAGVPGYEVNSWQGLFAPAGTTSDIIQKLHKSVTSALLEPSIRAQLEGLGYEIVASTPEALQQQLNVLIPKWAEIVKMSGAKPD